MTRERVILSIIAILIVSFSPFAQEGEKKNAYSLDICVVSGQKLGSMGDPVVYKHGEVELKFCCAGCIPKFEKNPAIYLKKFKQLVEEARPKDSYPLDICVVSGQKLGSMGDPVVYKHGEVELKFCCESCIPKFEKNPAIYLKKLKDLTQQGRHEGRQGDAYPLDICAVSGQKLGTMGDPVVYNHGDVEIRFCCEGCIPKFKETPGIYLNKVNRLVIERQLPYYPMDTCLVSGKKLGEAGKPIDWVYQNRLLRFSWKGCIPAFAKATEKYLADLDRAVVKAQLATYPMTTCPVSGEKLGTKGEPFNFVHANRLIRFCCRECVKEFRANPTKFMGELDRHFPDVNNSQ